MPYYLASLSYDGSFFFGWVKQPTKNTAQQYLEDTFSKIFKQKVLIKGFSRLDKWAHAKDQSIFFYLNVSLNISKLLLILRKTLKTFFFVNKIKEVNADFTSKFYISQREYRYFINTGLFNVWKNKYRWELNEPLLINQLTECFDLFQGEHDFFNFCHCSLQNKEKMKTKRSIKEIKVLNKNNIVIIKIKAKGFLRYQVRAIVGEVVNCCLKKQSLNALLQKLNFVHTEKYRFLAPANGLYLWKTFWKKKKKTSLSKINVL